MIQCFVNASYETSFEHGKQPRLISASKIDSVYTIHPRVLHKHKDYLEVLYVRTGTGVYIIDETHYAIKAGDIIICNVGMLHDEDPTKTDNLNTLCIAVGNVFVKNLPPNHLIAEQYSPVFPAGECADIIESLMANIHSMLASSPMNSVETCNYLTSALLSKILLIIKKYCSTAGTMNYSKPDIITAQVKRYINTHFDEKFTLQDIGDAIRISPYHLSHIFKNQTGYSPMQYTLRRRLGEAQSLLISTNLSVTEISVAVGFGNPCHFNNMFSKYVGMPPSRYRAIYVNRELPNKPINDIVT